MRNGFINDSTLRICGKGRVGGNEFQFIFNEKAKNFW